MTFFEAFIDEYEKIAKRRRKKKWKAWAKTLGAGALLGASIRSLGEIVGAPILYATLRKRGVPVSAAKWETALKIPHAAAQGAPFGALVLGLRKMTRPPRRRRPTLPKLRK